MISVVVLAEKSSVDLKTKNSELLNTLADLKISYEILYLASPNFSQMEDLKQIVGQNEKHNLIVCAEDTNKNSKIYVGLDSTRGDSVLLLENDVDTQTVKDVLQKYKDGFENIFVQKKENAVYKFFEKLGEATYRLGLKMLRKLPDICCDGGVVLLNGATIDAILQNPWIEKEILNTNLTPEKRSCILQEKIVHHEDSKNQHPQSYLFWLGMLSLVFIVVTLGAMFFYPMFNGWVYSLWIFIAIILWLALCAVICVVVSKQIYNARQGEKIPLDIDGLPLINLQTTYTHKELENEYQNEPTKEEVIEEKPKTKTKKSEKTTKTKSASTKKEKTTKKPAQKQSKTKKQKNKEKTL